MAFAFQRIIPSQFRRVLRYATRVSFAMVRKTKFWLCRKISLPNILVLISVVGIWFIGSNCLFVMPYLSQRAYLIPALPACLTVRSASGQQAELGVGVNLKKPFVYYLRFSGMGRRRNLCIYQIIATGRVLLGTKTFQWSSRSVPKFKEFFRDVI